MVSEQDFNRFQFFQMMVAKLTRYAKNWKTGHQDSLRDLIVYTAMLEYVDSDLIKEESIESIRARMKKMHFKSIIQYGLT